MSGAAASKGALRRSMRARLASIDPGDRARWSASIVEAIASSEAWTAARGVLLYLGDEHEPNLDPLIERGWRAGKRVGAPRMDWPAGTMRGVELGSPAGVEVRRHGIREPVEGEALEAGAIDLALIPGVAFDASGGRLGRGAGFYDRYLSGLGTGVVRVGVCFGAQVVASVPRETHDLGVDALVSESGFMLCRRGEALD